MAGGCWGDGVQTCHASGQELPGGAPRGRSRATLRRMTEPMPFDGCPEVIGQAGTDVAARADVGHRPPRAELYLGLWNRGAEVTESGIPVLERWRERHRVRWA